MSIYVLAEVLIVIRFFFSVNIFFLFLFRIEVDDRTEAYLRVLQQSITRDTNIVCI